MKKIKLSTQAISAFAMALLKVLAEGISIDDILGNYELVEKDGKLHVLNPVVTAKIPDQELDLEEYSEVDEEVQKIQGV